MQQLAAIGAARLLAVDVDGEPDLARLPGVVALDRPLLLVLLAPFAPIEALVKLGVALWPSLLVVRLRVSPGIAAVAATDCRNLRLSGNGPMFRFLTNWKALMFAGVALLTLVFVIRASLLLMSASPASYAMP